MPVELLLSLKSDNSEQLLISLKLNTAGLGWMGALITFTDQRYLKWFTKKTLENQSPLWWNKATLVKHWNMLSKKSWDVQPRRISELSWARSWPARANADANPALGGAVNLPRSLPHKVVLCFYEIYEAVWKRRSFVTMRRCLKRFPMFLKDITAMMYF